MTSSDAIKSLRVDNISNKNEYDYLGNIIGCRIPNNEELMAKLNELIEKFNYLVEVVSNGNV